MLEANKPFKQLKLEKPWILHDLSYHISHIDVAKIWIKCFIVHGIFTVFTFWPGEIFIYLDLHFCNKPCCILYWHLIVLREVEWVSVVRTKYVKILLKKSIDHGIFTSIIMVVADHSGKLHYILIQWQDDSIVFKPVNCQF